jgi:hypothetical protein
MTAAQTTLWENILQLELDDPAADFSFSDRLARENGWELGYALRAIYEYKRFMFLICIAPHPLTPSDEVDQVWHLHLLYTQSYWDELCGQILQRKVHHGPTKGGHQERKKFGDWYDKTLALYTATFGQPAPSEIWPSGEKRFADIHFRRVNTRTHWTIKKPKFLNP